MDILFSIVSPAEFSALFQVILVDLVLAGDNAIVIGMAAAGLPREYRAKVIFFGIAAATVMRIGFAAITVQLLQITGLLLIGGLLLVWVAWKLWVELRTPHAKPSIDDPSLEQSEAASKTATEAKRKASPKQLRQAVLNILIADVSMSLDNVLAVAGIARDSTWILVTGLVLSVALMGFAASWIARLLDRHRWIAYIGLITIVYVAGVMVYDGGQEILCAFEYIECQAPPAAGG